MLLALELMQLLLGLVLQALVLLALVLLALVLVHLLLVHLLLALLLEKLEKMHLLQTHCHLKVYCPADRIQLSGLERKVHADYS
jgi:hypothetical protein